MMSFSKQLRIIGGGCGMLLLAGCATSQTQVPSRGPIEVPIGWAMAEPSGAELELSSYWTLLGDPLINQFVEQAQRENLDIAQAAARLAIVRASLREARASRLPGVSANGSIQRDVGDFSQNNFGFGLGADVSWETDLFGRISARIDSAEADLIAAGYTRADTERAIVAQVVLQSITAKQLAMQLEIARASLAIQDENLQIARWRREAGLVSSLDVEQARTQRAQTAATIPQIEGDLAATANALSTLLGETSGRVLEEISNSARVPAPPQTANFSAPAEILRRRPDVRAAEAQLASDTARIGLARAQLSPLVRLTGTVGTNSIGIDNLFDIITGNLFASMSQLIFDGGRTRAQIDQAEAVAEGSLAAWKRSILIALEDVETSAVQLRSARQRTVLFDEASGAAENAALLARSQYQAGLIDFQILLTAESQLLSARNSAVSAEASRASAFTRLARALGGGSGQMENMTVIDGDSE
ncbi:efflux transporter outer membrane subunit [Altererythrobacter gangjinensis]|uniref:Efflux transporter outer membrane subunit n=2 Tax=Pontixanthobacter gangjinensis TaxID=1028742 RepID=A0A6I4SJE8_9SPHN|nr:efflux transporter outer membrane subunit [Pontixanthobacter gangjinensis]